MRTTPRSGWCWSGTPDRSRSGSSTASGSPRWCCRATRCCPSNWARLDRRRREPVGLAAPAASRGAFRAYLTKSRAPRYSLLFALPLFVLYEALAATLAGAHASNVRNAADVVLKTPFLMFSGARGSLAFFATVIAICVFFVARDLTKSRERPQPRMFLLMLGESAVLGLLLGVVVATLTQRLLGALSL